MPPASPLVVALSCRLVTIMRDGFPGVLPADERLPAPWEDPDATPPEPPKVKSCGCATDTEIMALLDTHHKQLQAVFDAQLAEATEQFRAQVAQLLASNTTRQQHQRLH